MAFKIIVEPKAQLDIDEAFEYYNKVSDDIRVINNLISDIEQAYKALRVNPYFQIKSKYYRALPLKNFLYLLFFEILEKEKVVKVLSLFNSHQNPNKYI